MAAQPTPTPSHLPELLVVVTEAALTSYRRARKLLPAEATREVLTLLAGRELRSQEGRRLLGVRARSRTLQIDVGATISLEPPLAVVVAVNVKDYR